MWFGAGSANKRIPMNGSNALSTRTNDADGDAPANRVARDATRFVSCAGAASILRRAFLACLVGLFAIGATGCLMRRTVKEGNEVVAHGYVVKSPLIAP
jgi:hypothetical protein